MKRFRVQPFLLVVLLGWTGTSLWAVDDVDFARDVLPILSNKCFVCHGPDSNDADMLRLDTEALATVDRGGYRAIDQEKPKKSAALERILSKDAPMPPEDAEKQLTESERSILVAWIKQGGRYAKHWAFVPPVKTAPKSIRNASREHTLDAFIQDGFKVAGVTFNSPAEKHVLARRVALVLTGLPPELDVLNEYLKDDSKDAYTNLVETLLASPRFGEHQARYWLDAVRYGDTHGLHLDNRRGIFPYRDWVVSAINDNLPFDEFITWQLAGDLLPQPTLQQIVATGFVRMNPSTAEGGAIPAEFQAKNNFDRTETLGTVLLGMTLTCSRCHTHKYDPITQTEYYELLAFFNNTAESAMDGNSYTYAPVIKAPQDQQAWQNWKALESKKTEVVRLASDLIGDDLMVDEAQKQAWDTADVEARMAQLADVNGPFATHEVHQTALAIKAEAEEAAEGYTTTLVAKELDKPRETKILHRGEYNQPQGESLQPDVLSIMGSFPEDAPRNRLGLAAWLTSDDHPVMSRVIVNRMWARVFGHPLVRTPEDFGVQGEQPTHPELLDWLAVDFRENGWDVKDMLRLMVHSRTFQQSSGWRDEVEDPENRLFARGPSYRLDAEVLRDIALWASGLLSPHMGGEGVKPYQPDGMWKALAHPASNTKQYVRDNGELLYRRSLYVYWKRTSPHPMMTLFDAPDRESSCVQRQRTNTALQSLGLLNEIQRIEMGRILAERLLSQETDDTARVDLLFRLLASRDATAQERRAILGLVAAMKERFSQQPDDAKSLLSLGEAEQNETLDAVLHAAWTQATVVVLASDPAILLY